MKKILMGLACSSMILTGAISTTFAAGDINPDEERLLAYFEQGIKVGDESLSYSKASEEYQTIKEILAADGVDLNAQEVDTIRDSAKDVQTYLASIDVNQKMTVEILGQLISKSSPALDVLGLKASYDSAKDILTIMTKSGEVIGTMDNLIGKTKDEIPTIAGDKLEKTGENFGSTYAIIGSLAVILIFAGFVTLKKKEAK